MSSASLAWRKGPTERLQPSSVEVLHQLEEALLHLPHVRHVCEKRVVLTASSASSCFARRRRLAARSKQPTSGCRDRRDQRKSRVRPTDGRALRQERPRH